MACQRYLHIDVTAGLLTTGLSVSSNRGYCDGKERKIDISCPLTDRLLSSIIKLQSDRGISYMAPVLFFMICAFAHSFWQFLPDIRYPIRHRQKQPKKHILFLTSFCQDKCRLAAAKQEEHETEYHIL